jgi:hypothetical protein
MDLAGSSCTQSEVLSKRLEGLQIASGSYLQRAGIIVMQIRYIIPRSPLTTRTMQSIIAILSLRIPANVSLIVSIFTFLR